MCRLLLVALIIGCGGLQTRPDGGAAGGGSAGGTAGGSAGGTAGGSAGGTAGGSAGGTAGGSAGGNAGGSAGGNAGGSGGGSAGGTAGGAVSPPFDAGVFAGDGGAFAWETFLNPSGTNLTALTAVRAFAVNDVWMVARAPAPFENLVFHFDGGAISNPLDVSDPTPVSDLELTRTPRRLAVAHGGELFVCDRDDGGCLLGQHWSVLDGGPGDLITGLCSDGSRFYGAGASGGQGAIFRDFTVLATYPTAGPLHDCHVRADGFVLATGVGRLAVYQPDGGSSLLDVTPAVLFTAIHGLGYQVFLAGPSGHVVELRYDGTFVTRLTTGPLSTLAGAHPRELFAAGGTSMARFDGAQWATTAGPSANIRLIGMTAVDANTYYAVGVERDAGQLLRARR